MKFAKAIVMTLVLSIFAGSAFAATKKELQDRFKQRYSEIQQFKSKGVIGETAAGYVDFVKARDSNAARLVDAENADRRELYKIIADEEKTTPDTVAQRNAKRNFEKARPGEYLKGSDGTWKQKA